MDALAHFKQGKGIDKLGETEKVEEDNKNYFDETMDLEKYRTDLRESLYGDFNQSEMLEHQLGSSEMGIDNDSGNNKFKEEYDNGELVGDRPELGKNQSFTGEEPDLSNQVVGEYQKETGEEKFFNEKHGTTLEVEKSFDIKELNVFKENPLSPIIDRFSKLPGINLSNEHKIQIAKVLNNPEVKELNIDSINKMELDYQLKILLKNYINEINRLNPGFNENKDIDNFELPDEFKSIDLLNNNESEVIQLLASNYIKIPDGTNGESNFEADIQTAFDVSLNKIIELRQFPRNESFDIAVKDIKNGDLETKLEALSYIYSLVNTHEGLKGAKSKVSFDKIKNGHINKKTSYIEFKVKQIEKQIENTSNEIEKNKLIEELEKFDKLKNIDDFKGEVFSGGEEDKVSEEDPLANLDSK